MSLFGEKKQISRRDLRKKLRSSSSYIPNKSLWTSSGETYNEKERVEIEKDVFGKKYGSYISKPEYKKAIRELESKKHKTRNNKEKFKIDRKIRYLEKLNSLD